MTKINFVDRKKMNPDMTINIVFRMCPLHLLKLDEALKKAKIGDVIEIITTYDGALEDIPAWCERTGNEFLGIDASDDRYHLFVGKKNEWRKNLPRSRCNYACLR
jgi:TusA-related sulfurtransferase